MTITLSTFSSSNSPLKPTNIPFKSALRAPIFAQIHNQKIPLRSFSIGSQSLKLGLSSKNFGFSFGRNLGFAMKSENGEGDIKNDSVDDKAEGDDRGDSSMPDRFRRLTKEAPDPPVRPPWFIALFVPVFAWTWRTVLWELSNWTSTVKSIINFFAYLLKFVLAFIFHFIGYPITSLIQAIETSIYTVRAFYSGIIAYAPIQDLTTIIVLVSFILAIAEATVPDSVSSQPYLLTAAAIIGFAAVRSHISELFFWILLFGLFGFARFVKKRDYVSSALPAAAVLAAVGEPWIRVLAIISYTSLAITHYSKKKKSFEGNEGEDVMGGKQVHVPVPLLCAAMAIGIRVAAKWAGYRHLTWMIV